MAVVEGMRDGCFSAIAVAHGQLKKWRLSGSQLSLNIRQGLTAAFLAAGRQSPTLSDLQLLGEATSAF